MPRLSQLLARIIPAYLLAFLAWIGATFGSNDLALHYLSAGILAVVLMLGSVVSYLHRLLYGEDGGEG